MDTVTSAADAAAFGVTVTAAETELTFRVAPGERVLGAARRAGVWLPFECGWGSCGTCKVTLVEGEVSLLFPEAPAIDERDVRRRRTITCQTTATSDLVLKAHRVGPVDERPTADFRGTLVEVEPLGPDIARFHFQLDAVARYLPGQYAILEPTPGLRRCYSMAGLPGRDRVEFIAKRYAGRPGSTALFELSPGAQLPIELPYGDMWLRPGDDPVLLIAGGTGISPVLAMLRQLAGEAADREIHVVYGANTRAELAAWDEVEALAGSLPRATLHGVLADPPAGWAGAQGLVPEVLAPLLGAEPRCYLAGPPVMVDAVMAVLREAGVSLARVHYDRFG